MNCFSEMCPNSMRNFHSKLISKNANILLYSHSSYKVTLLKRHDYN